MATIPMISPDGAVGDVPQARVHDAVAKGFKIAMDMSSPDGKLGAIPLDNVHQAMSKGFRMVTAPAAGGDLINQDIAKAQAATRAAGPYTQPGAAEAGMGFGVPASETLRNAGQAIATGANYAAPIVTGGASLPVQMAAQGGTAAAQTASEGGSTGDIAKSGAIGAAIPPVAEGVTAAVTAIAKSPTVRALVQAAPKVAVKQSYFGKVGLELLKIARQAGEDVDGLLDATGENRPFAGERSPAATPPPPGVEPPAPRIPAKQLPPIPGVNVPPNVGRIQPVIPTEPPAPANPDYVPFRPSIERIIDEVKNEPGFKNVSRADLDARFSKALAEVQQEAAQAPKAQPEDLAGKLQQTLDQIKARGKQMAPRVPKESLDDFNARLAKIADAKKAARSLEDLQ